MNNTIVKQKIRRTNDSHIQYLYQTSLFWKISNLLLIMCVNVIRV